MSRQDIHHELLFCLLGGFGITYELGQSATRIIAGLEPFADWWEDQALFAAITKELTTAQFEPLRRNGEPRRYRFPRRKATLIVNARRWLRENAPLAERLQDIPTGQGRRRFLCRCPGLGPKAASWFLRNVGFANELAIVDIHLIRALREAGRISDDIRMPRDYESVEAAFLGWCSELGAPPPAFDLFVWEWQRGCLALS